MIHQNIPASSLKKRILPYRRVVILAGGTLLVLSALTYIVIRSTRPPAPAKFLTAMVQKGNLSQTDSATGEIVPVETYTVSIPANASLSQLNVSLGQSVNSGQILATFSDPALASQVAAQNAAVLNDQNQVNLLSSSTYRAAQQASITQAEDNLQQAEDQLAQAKSQGVITSPVAGTLTQVAPVGESVSSGQVLATVGGKTIVSPCQGTVQSVNVTVGQQITTGTTILTLSSPSLTSKILGDESQVAGLQAALDKIMSQDSQSQLAASLDQAKAQLERDQQTLLQEQQALANLVIKAPFSGEVTMLNSSAQAGAKLLTLDSETKMVTVPIPETQINLIHPGQSVSVSLPALVGKAVSGTVQSIAPIGNYSNGVANFPVNVTLNNVGGIRYGMSAQVSIVVKTVHNALLVPLASLHSRGSHNFVEVLASSGQVTRIPVHVLLENATTAAVKSKRLKVHDQVITAVLTSPSGKLHLKAKGRALHKGKAAGRKGGSK
ncbi:HlyD family efflux transporter periplasmic adaptor subunit [Sulfobacillus thermosulfidooxidans]|uniref:HlyD family efflux transporter periplasmic adaptor subunit n=1 Tax=Sulfobacillus thermosulfidooxidans TaxID=28034 RepID=UPI0006B41686|nr:HlyD family efflux transporter periplasmic adaptor subunit [Sulfobacillus thermosulfidooxidans]